MTGRALAVTCSVFQYRFLGWPSRAGLSNLLLRLCAEVTREKSFLSPRPLINFWLLMAANNCIFPLEQTGTCSESKEPGPLRAGCSLKWLEVNLVLQAWPHQELPLPGCSLFCFWDNTDLVCLKKFLPWENLWLKSMNTYVHGWQFWLPNGWYKTH